MRRFNSPSLFIAEISVLRGISQEKKSRIEASVMPFFTNFTQRLFECRKRGTIQRVCRRARSTAPDAYTNFHLSKDANSRA